MIVEESGKGFHRLFKGAFKWRYIKGLVIRGSRQESLEKHMSCNPDPSKLQPTKSQIQVKASHCQVSQNVLVYVKMQDCHIIVKYLQQGDI